MYHNKITSIFGADLFKLLGPKQDRVPWDSLSEAEKKSRLNRIPVYVSTRQLGKHPSLIDIVIHCFNRLVAMGLDNPLLGIDIPELNSLAEAADQSGVPPTVYDREALQGIETLYKNSAKQRDVFLRHIFEDIIFRFRPNLVFAGVGRKNSKLMIMVNDAQHRILACIMLGIEYVPLHYIVSDDEYWDVAQYAAINIHSLSASEFDKYRIRVQRNIEAIAANMPTEAEDQLSHELHDLFTNLGIQVAEKGDNLGTNGLVLTSIGNMIKYRKEYNKDFFHRAVTLNAQMFPTSKFHTANSWGLMEFFTYQDSNLDPMQMDFAVMNSLKKRWSKSNVGNQMHEQFKEAYRAQTNVSATASRAPEPLIIAHGIYQVCTKYEPDFKWVEPEWDVTRHGPKYTFKMI